MKCDSLSTVQDTVEEKTSSLPMNQAEEEMVDPLQGTSEEKSAVNQGEKANSFQNISEGKTAVNQEETADSLQDTVNEQALSLPPSDNGNAKSSRTLPLTPEPIPVPPPVPRSGVPILAHKLWIGNLDKRLTE